MLKVVDVVPEITFNDHYQGVINIREVFNTVHARDCLDAEFSRFAHGCLMTASFNVVTKDMIARVLSAS